jgi:hypothetical protein
MLEWNPGIVVYRVDDMPDDKFILRQVSVETINGNKFTYKIKPKTMAEAPKDEWQLSERLAWNDMRSRLYHKLREVTHELSYIASRIDICTTFINPDADISPSKLFFVRGR